MKCNMFLVQGQVISCSTSRSRKNNKSVSLSSKYHPRSCSHSRSEKSIFGEIDSWSKCGSGNIRCSSSCNKEGKEI